MGAGAAHRVQRLHHPSSPQKKPLRDFRTSRHWCLPLWLPARPSPVLCVCCSGQQPVPGLTALPGSHTHMGWAGRTPSLTRRNASSHGYIKLCHGARQKQHNKSLNVAVSAFVLTKAKSKTSSENASYLDINILSIFFWILKNLVSIRFQGQLLCKLIIRKLFLRYKYGWRHCNYERTFRNGLDKIFINGISALKGYFW